MIDPNLKNPLEKLKLYEKELELAKNSGDSSKIFDGLFNLGKFCYEIDAHGLSKRYVEEAFVLSKKYSNFKNEYKFYTLRGDNQFQDGHYSEAHQSYKKSNKKFPKLGDKEWQAENYFKWGKVSLISKQVELFKKSLKIYYTLDKPTEIANVLYQIGLSYINKASLKSSARSINVRATVVTQIAFHAKKKAYIKILTPPK